MKSSILVNDSYAEESTVTSDVDSNQQQQSNWMSILPLFLIIIVFYFLVVRPQQKKLKEHQSMVDNVKKGDMVITTGGIIARVLKVDNESSVVVLEIADNVQIKLKKTFISTIEKAESKK